MVKNLSLKNRTKGPWTNFEAFLLKPENTHTGWVRWIGKQTFLLIKNPLSENPQSPYTYVVPEDIADNISENMLIRITDGSEVKSIEYNGKKLYGTNRYFYVMENFVLVDVEDLPKPYLYKSEELEGFPTNRHERVKDFLYRITQSWKNSEDNQLFQKELAYNLLSCQRDFYGAGGIGTETFIPGGKKQKMKNLIMSTKRLLPGEFKISNNYYQYKILQNERDIENTKKRRLNTKVNEISYNDTSKIDPKIKTSGIQIQIPLIVPDDVTYRKQEFFDPDIMDYQLHALLFKPAVRQEDIKKFTDLAIKTSQYIGKEYTEETLMVDSFSLLKIATSMCRLHLTDELTEDFLPTVKDELFQMFKEYADIREEFSMRGQLTRWSSLTKDARLVYGEINKISKENKEMGIDWVSVEKVKPKFDNYVLDRALCELNEYGFIIHRMHFSDVSIVDHRK